MEDEKIKEDERVRALRAQADALLKELEERASTPEWKARVAAIKRSCTPEARKAEAERRERCRQEWEEQNRGFPPGVTFQDIEIA
ncbi:hypothetical protein HZA87_01420 [Candidatus Uhrbacteria bacterium]|nr:hypothetical protein [Candidatus Uhrbacteria bacterium]